MGLCFSVNQKKKYVPKTLIELYRNLERNEDVEFKFPDPLHGDLTNWAKQGVFMLNTCLTTRKWKRGSHRWKGWENFTKETIKAIDRNCKGVVYLLFGSHA